ncbi:MAG: hypothetical protein JSS20_10645 [Proteobacteria bacterium]|nr:hypothetical protein [Pseudomonadota bacterium]
MRLKLVPVMLALVPSVAAAQQTLSPTLEAPIPMAALLPSTELTVPMPEPKLDHAVLAAAPAAVQIDRLEDLHRIVKLDRLRPHTRVERWHGDGRRGEVRETAAVRERGGRGRDLGRFWPPAF